MCSRKAHTYVILLFSVGRLGVAVGTGQASLALAGALGRAYDSTIFGRLGVRARMFLLLLCAGRPATNTSETLAHQRMRRGKLSLDAQITWHHLPMWDDEVGVVFKEWPFILPTDFARALLPHACSNWCWKDLS